MSSAVTNDGPPLFLVKDRGIQGLEILNESFKGRIADLGGSEWFTGNVSTSKKSHWLHFMGELCEVRDSEGNILVRYANCRAINIPVFVGNTIMLVNAVARYTPSRMDDGWQERAREEQQGVYGISVLTGEEWYVQMS